MKAVITGFVLLLLSALSVFACSYADGYLPFTTYELIKDTEAIVLAQPTAKKGYEVDFKVLEVLKGSFQGEHFHGWEAHSSCADYSYLVERDEIPGFPGQLLRGRPKIKPLYLLFLKKSKSGWAIDVNTADRLNQEILDAEDSSFLRNVRHFIQTGSLNNYEAEKRELIKLRRLARSGRDQKLYPKELVDLIDDHFRRPTSKKSYRDLASLYARSPKTAKREVLWAFAWGAHPEAANFITELLKSRIPTNYIGPISEYITQTKNEDLLVRLGRNYPGLDKHSRWPLMWAMIKTANERQLDMMLAALRSADNEEAGRLAEWFVRYPNVEATEIVRDLVGNDYQKNWELAFNLSGMGDEGTVKWAKEFMASPDEDRWMAFYTIAYSPLDEADKLAISVINGDDPEGLASLIQGYGDSHNPNRWDRLRDITNLEHRDEQVDSWLKRTLAKMAEEGDKTAESLLVTVNRP